MFHLNGWRPIHFGDCKEVTLSPQVMAFSIHILARRFALLFLQLPLLLFDPGKFGDRKYANGLDAHSLRGSNSHTSCRRMHAQMDILDVFPHDVDGDIAELDSSLHQYSVCALMMRNTR